MNNPDLSSWTALIVDDAYDNAQIAERIFKHWGAQVHVARSGREALNILETVVPTFVLLDLDMPQMNGWQVRNTIRENTELDHVPVIAFTAHAMPSEKGQIMRDGGFDGCITKPFSIKDIVEEIQRYLAHA